MTIRVGGRAVRPDAAELRGRLPRRHRPGRGLPPRPRASTRATGTPGPREMGGTYGSRLAESAGWTPVFLRVNTGLSVAENGVALTALLQELVETWPVQVAPDRAGRPLDGRAHHPRRAARSPPTTPSPGSDRLSDVVTLGTPHLGADLALGVSHGSSFLGPAARDRRLRPDPRAPLAGHPRPRAGPARAAPAARRRLPPGLGGAGLASAARSAPLFGDLLVRRASATGLRRSLRLFPDADVLHVANAGHFALLNHPEVDHAMSAAGWHDAP